MTDPRGRRAVALLAVAACLLASACQVQGDPVDDRKLVSLNEVTLAKLIGVSPSTRLEGSGLSFRNKTQMLHVVLDNRLDHVISVPLSALTGPKGAKRAGPAGVMQKLTGMERIESRSDLEGTAWSEEKQRHYAVLEYGVFLEFDEKWNLLATHYPDAVNYGRYNKGIEGLANFVGKDGLTYLLALCETNHCGDGGHDDDRGHGIVYVVPVEGPRAWRPWKIKVPHTAMFKDYSGIDVTPEGRVVIISQEDSAMWVGTFDLGVLEFNSRGSMYFFPRLEPQNVMMHCNVEGVAWVDETTFVTVSDKAKSSQHPACKLHDQAMALWSLPKRAHPSPRLHVEPHVFGQANREVRRRRHMGQSRKGSMESHVDRILHH